MEGSWDRQIHRALQMPRSMVVACHIDAIQEGRIVVISEDALQ
jgi:hypothetical protein